MLNLFRKANRQKDKAPDSALATREAASATGSVTGRGETAAEMDLSHRTGMYQKGYEWAKKERDTRENPGSLEALDRMAEAMARAQATRRFEPEAHADDHLKQDQYESTVGRIKCLRADIGKAEEEVRRRDDALAELGEVPKRPRTPWGVLVVGGLFIALTVAPTFHDFLFGNIRDQRHAWAFSILSGFAIGGFFAWCLIGTAKNTTAKRAAHWFGLVAGLMMGIGLLAVRLMGAHTQGALILAVGLALLEMSAVLLLDWVGRGLRHQHAEFETVNAEYLRRLRLLEASQRDLAYRQAELAKLETQVGDHHEYVTWRDTHCDIEQLVEEARRTIRAGYQMGVAENAAQMLRSN